MVNRCRFERGLGLLVVCCFIIFCACQPTGDRKNEGSIGNVNFQDIDVGEDYDRSDSHLGGRFTDTENAAYFITGGSLDTTDGKAMLWYIDKKTGVSGPLCGKPECTHSDFDCNACLGSGPEVWGISAYGNKLYYVAENMRDAQGLCLYAVNPDGTGRKQVRRLESQEEIKPLADKFVQFHRGLCLISGTVNGIEDGEQYSQFFITAYPLDGGNKLTVFSSEKYSDSVVTMKMQPAGDEIFFVEALMDVQTRKPDKLCLRKWNLKNKETEVLYEGDISFLPYEFWVRDEEILFSCIEPSGGEIYRFDREKADFQVKFCFSNDCGEERAISIVDGKLISYNYVTKYSERRIEIRDFEGNQTYYKTDAEPLLDEKELPYIRCLLGADSSRLYYMFSDLNMINTKDHPETLVKSISFDGEEQVLWTTLGGE